MKDLTGKRFGRLTVLKLCDEKVRNYKYKWLCKCDCGKEKSILGDSLKGGKTSSCGCLQKESTSLANRRHYGKGTRLHNIWLGMKSRCYYAKNIRYDRYGGRGITICEEWKKSFISFRDWALSNGYREDLTIDRIDVDGNYCPENCRWATYKEQFENSNVSNEFLKHINGGLKNKRIKEFLE